MDRNISMEGSLGIQVGATLCQGIGTDLLMLFTDKFNKVKSLFDVLFWVFLILRVHKPVDVCTDG